MNTCSSPSGRGRSLLADDEINGRAGLWLWGLSFFLHLMLLVALFVMQQVTPPRMIPQVVQVDLISFDPGSGETRAVSPPVSSALPEPPLKEDDSSRERALPEPESGEVPVVVPDRQLKSKPLDLKKKKKKKKPPVKKRALKSTTFKPKKVLEKARKDLAKDVEESARRDLDKSMARLREKVKGAKRSSGPSVGTSLEKGGRPASRAIELYNLEIMYGIQQNWAFNRQLARGDKDLEVRILIKILKSGELRDIFVETRSGNRYLDESAIKAIRKSVPFPRLPKGYSSYDVGLIFTPSGVK